MSERVATFDHLASGYDANFTDHPIAQTLRKSVYSVVASHVGGRSDVLEIGCGTGVDATWFAGRGCNVLATDVSQEMLAVSIERVAGLDDALSSRIEFARLDLNKPTLPEQHEKRVFDLIYSNFGALNCAQDLGQFAFFAVQHLRVNGILILTLMNRYCAWEFLGGVSKLDFRAATRRWRGSAMWESNGHQLEVRYPTVSSLRRQLAPEFKLLEVKGIGVFLPPSEWFNVVQTRPRLLSSLSAVEKATARWWPFDRLGDHVTVVFQKT